MEEFTQNELKSEEALQESDSRYEVQEEVAQENGEPKEVIEDSFKEDETISDESLTDYILSEAKRVNNFDLLMKARDSEKQGQVIWGTVRTVVNKALWKPREVGYEEAIIEVETNEGFTVYINQRNLSYHMPALDRLIFMVGEEVPIIVSDHVRIDGTRKSGDDVNYKPNADYVLLGSIKQAEWSLSKEFELLYHRENSPLKKEMRGIVLEIIEPHGIRGQRLVRVGYNGIPINIPAAAFSYVSQSQVQRLEDIVKVGQEVYFKVFAIEEQPVTAQMRERHGVMGENETYWSIVGEALYNKEEPHAAISRLKRSGAIATQAYLVSETMDGYFVELVDAPGIILRMNARRFQPTHEMVENHQIVVVRLDTLIDSYVTTEDGRDLYQGYVTYFHKR
jgi:hypothetical protein